MQNHLFHRMALFQSKQIASPESAADMTYLLGERVSVQWFGFLQAFSAEMNSQLSTEEYRELLRNMGQRFAALTAVGTKETVEELEVAINAQWSGLRWGYARLSDSGAQLSIQHHYSPLPEALGVDHAVAGGFLEGVYEHWFRAAGADDMLSVRQTVEDSTATVATFLFGRHA